MEIYDRDGIVTMRVHPSWWDPMMTILTDHTHSRNNEEAQEAKRLLAVLARKGEVKLTSAGQPYIQVDLVTGEAEGMLRHLMVEACLYYPVVEPGYAARLDGAEYLGGSEEGWRELDGPCKKKERRGPRL